MEAHCLRQTELPHTSRLFADFQYHFDRVQKYYRHWPGRMESYAEAAREICYPDERRTALVAALAKRNAGNPNLELLAQPTTLAVVTGQQTGLFSGPAYTIYKALTAARLAQTLTMQGIPAVPVFWLATEDHDLAEVNHCYVFSDKHRPVALKVDGDGEAQQPVGTIQLGPPPIGDLRAALRGLPFGDSVVNAVAAAYQPGATFGEAFWTLLRGMLEKWGLLVIDPLDADVRRIAAPLLSQALKAAPELKTRLLERNQELEAAGYHAQVHLEPQTSLFFLLEGNRRITLRRQDDGYASKERRYSTEDLLAHAEQLSPNALLRPVAQDYLLPTVAYVGGPAELAYFAQSQVLYEGLLGRMPVLLARAGFTLLDGAHAKLMSRYGLTIPDFFHGEGHVRETIAKKLAPRELTSEFQQVRGSTEQSLKHLRESLLRFDPTLATALDKSGAKMMYQLTKIENKTAREALRRDTRAAEDAAGLSNLIYPEKHLQERYYSILPFLAKHGPGLLDTLYENVHLDCPDHKVLVV
jgi:bacillithiol biosynthesis cysteine-adding enzyme BshC